MSRRIAVYALAVCSLFVASAATASHGIRVEVAPGASLAFATGWEVCANTIAQGLYRFTGIPRFECGGASGRAILMRYMVSGQPVDLSISHIDDPSASEVMLKAAPAGFVEKMSDHLCAEARSRPGYDVASCEWVIGTLAGHTVFKARGIVTATNDPLKMKYEISGFSAADRTGYLTVVATTPVMVRNKTDVVIAAMQNSLLVDTPVADASSPAPPVRMVALSPAPGVSFQVPEDWIACDDATEALLHSARDSMKVKDRICAGSPGVAAVLRAFDPRPLHLISLTFNYRKQQLITPEALADTVQSDLDALRFKLCNMEAGELPAGSLDCRITVGSIAGHRALISTIADTLPDASEWLIVSYEVPYAQGYMQIQFGHADLVTKLVEPQIDAILATLHIDDGTVTAPSTSSGPDTAEPNQAPPPPPATVPKNSI